jgi:predicted GNAT superfamily acetyltransferase
MLFRDLTTLDDFARVVELERTIWGPGYDEVVPVPILAVTVLRGGVLIGAFDDQRMIGFVYSLAAIKHGRPTQWSHMLGVLPDGRSAGVGRELKRLQRERTLAMGLDLIEWTYDPMQALNAHLNFAKLGVVAQEYEINVYGTSSSPLHAGNPTDRFVAEWHVREPHVERRLAAASRPEALAMRSAEVGDAESANQLTGGGRWPACAGVRLDLDARRVLVHIPVGFTEMLASDPDAALAWRMATRELFTTYFARGYKAVDFLLNRAAGRGAYLLARSS